MQAVVRHHRRLGATCTTDRGDVDEGHAALRAGLARREVVGIQLARDLCDIAAGLRPERGHTPVGNRQHQHAIGPVAGEADGTPQQRGELRAVLLHIAAAVLVVHADQQADEVVLAQRLGGGDRGIQLVGGPAGGGDDARVAEQHAFHAQEARQLHRPAACLVHGFADRVGIAQREVAQLSGEGSGVGGGDRGHGRMMRCSDLL